MERSIGFVGCYSHDVILMLTKVFGYMGKRVLLRDRNKQHTLQVSVPIPDGTCAAKTVLEYDGFLFTEQSTDRQVSEEYEVEIIDFGMEVNTEEAERCQDFIVVTDMLLHHVRRLNDIRFPRERVLACVMRDSFAAICRGEQEVMMFMQSFPDRTVYFLPPDHRDVKNRYVCETLHEYSVAKASPEMQDLIYRMVELVYPDYTEKEIRKAIRRSERRNYR